MLGLQKPKRPVSVSCVRLLFFILFLDVIYTHLQQVDSTSTINHRRISATSSIYSRRPMSTADFPPDNPAEESSDSQRVQFEDNPALRASLLSYQERWAFMQSTRNPFMEDSLNDEQPYVHGDVPATPIHRPPGRASHRNSFHPHNNSINNDSLEPASDDSLSTPPSPASSEATITPIRFHFMSEESSNAAPQESSADLGVNSLGVEEVSDIESKGNSSHSLLEVLDATVPSSLVPIYTALQLLSWRSEREQALEIQSAWNETRVVNVKLTYATEMDINNSNIKHNLQVPQSNTSTMEASRLRAPQRLGMCFIYAFFKLILANL